MRACGLIHLQFTIQPKLYSKSISFRSSVNYLEIPVLSSCRAFASRPSQCRRSEHHLLRTKHLDHCLPSCTDEKKESLVASSSIRQSRQYHISVTHGRRGSTDLMRLKKGGNKNKAVAKGDLPSKECAVCKRPFTWRKKWENCWDDVKYCSNRCRSNAKGTKSEKDDSSSSS